MRKPIELNPAFAITYSSSIDLAAIRAATHERSRLDDPRDCFLYELVISAEQHRSSLQLFAQMFVESPAHTLENAEQMMDVAAQFKVELDLIVVLTAPGSITLVMLRDRLIEEVLREARQVSNSTSRTSNVMNDYRRRCLTEWYNKLTFRVKSAEDEARYAEYIQDVATGLNKSDALAFAHPDATAGVRGRFLVVTIPAKNVATDHHTTRAVTWANRVHRVLTAQGFKIDNVEGQKMALIPGAPENELVATVVFNRAAWTPGVSS